MSALAWVATYLVHSTILILGAWLLERRWHDRPERMSAVWKVALVGGVATASLQMMLSITPLAGVYSVSPDASVPSDPVLAAGVASEAAPARESVPARRVVRRTSSAPVIVVQARRPEREPATVAPSASTPSAPSALDTASLLRGAGPWIIGGLTLGGLIGLFSVIAALAVLRQRLGGRQRLTEGSLATSLQTLRRRARLKRPVELAVCDAVQTPMAVGVLRPAIVVPREAMRTLSEEQQAGMLAHELAHVVRRDPAWRIVGLLVKRVLFFQPLNRLAAGRVSTLAEYLCDDWAARHTDAPLDLARCLTEVARWVAAPSAVAATMVGPRSILGRRVERLIQPTAQADRPWWLALPLGALLVSMLLVAPNVSAETTRANEVDASTADTTAAPPASPAVERERDAKRAQAEKAKTKAKAKRKKARAKQRRARAKQKQAQARQQQAQRQLKKAKAQQQAADERLRAYRMGPGGTLEPIEIDADLAATVARLERMEGDVEASVEAAVAAVEDLEDLDDDIEAAVEAAIESVEGLEDLDIDIDIDDLEDLAALQALGNLRVLGELDTADLEALQAKTELEIRDVELQIEALEALADEMDSFTLEGPDGASITVEAGKQVVIVDADGERLTVEVHDERSARAKARSRKRARKRARQRRRRRQR
ncbi:MAG: M56 family metallopeptidase [Myxococcota bacterium]